MNIHDLTKLIDKWENSALELREAETLINLLIIDNDRMNAVDDKLYKIAQWIKAYPLYVFPKPDFKKAAKALEQNGMTLDAISASNMRYVLSGMKEIIDA